ncbi:MAG TPA: dTDP-4-dehydrorhamnose 3,5-epimerase family protein [Mycobacteriales bacterium]
MQVDELAFGAFTVSPVLRGDDRGHFAETFRADVFEKQTGHPLHVAQVNTSVSRRGVIRGVHYALVPPGQAKYVSCLAGRLLDVVIDIRVGSPTFGRSAAVELDAETHNAVYIPEGLGHAFVALSEWATVNYLCSTPYNPDREFGVHPLDPALDLPFGAIDRPILSDRDAAAPTLAEAADLGRLPTYDEAVAFVNSL